MSTCEHIDCAKSRVKQDKQVKHLRTGSNVSKWFLSSRMAWDLCQIVSGSVVKIFVKLDMDRLSQPVIIAGRKALAPLMLIAKPLVSFQVKHPYHLPRISFLSSLYLYNNAVLIDL